MTDDNAEGDLVAAQLKEMQDQIKSLRTKFESAEARAQQAEETVRNAGIVAGTVETVHTSNHAKIATPRFIKGMSFDGYKSQVAAWQLMKVCPEHQEGLLLYMELPMDDAFGGLQSHVESIVGLHNLGKAGGAKKLLDALQKVLEKPEISQLREWWAQISQVRQKPGWNMERYILEVNKLIKRGREQYKVQLPNRVHASILTNGVTSIDQTMVAVLIKDIKLDGSGDEEADLHSQCEAALRNYVPAGGNIHEVHVARDVFGNKLRKASVSSGSSVASEEEVYYGQGGNLGRTPPVKRKFGQQMAKDEWEKHKKSCLKRGECFYCGTREHMARDCPVQKKKMEERKKAHLAQGKVWDNRDGTFSHPDGTTRNSSSVLLRGGGEGQDAANRVAYVANYQVRDSWGDAGFRRPERMLSGNMQSREQYDPSHYDPNYDPNDLVFENFVSEEDSKVKEDNEKKEGDEKKEGNEKKKEENPYMQDGDDAKKVIDDFLKDDDGHDVLLVNVPKYKVNADVLPIHCARKEAILDTGCSASCASEDWTKGYIENLSVEDKKRVVKKMSTNRFRFGDNQVYRSQGYVEAPVWIGGKRRMLGWDVLPQTTMPLLISLKVMKKLQMGLQMYEGNVDIATVEGVSFKIEHRQDHLWLDISPRLEEDHENDCGSVLLTSKNEKAETVEDVDHECNNSEPNVVKTVHMRKTLTRNQPNSSSADSSNLPPDVVDGPHAEPTSGQEFQAQAKGARGRKGKRGTSTKNEVRVQESDLKRGTNIEMVETLTNRWIPVHVNHRVWKGKQKGVEYNVTVAGYDKQVVDQKMMDWRYAAPEVGGDGQGSLSGRMKSILFIDVAATEQDLATSLQSDEKNPSEEDDLQVSGDNITRDVGNEKVSDVRIVNDETHHVCVVQVPFILHDEEKGDVRTYSPTVSRQALRLLITKAAQNQRKIKSFIGAFLQALFRSLVGFIQVSRPDTAYYGVALASKPGKASVNVDKVGLKQLKNMLDDQQIIKYNVLQDSGDSDATSQVADPLTKGGTNTDLLRMVLQFGQLDIVGVKNTEQMRRKQETDDASSE